MKPLLFLFLLFSICTLTACTNNLSNIDNSQKVICDESNAGWKVFGKAARCDILIVDGATFEKTGKQ